MWFHGCSRWNDFLYRLRDIVISSRFSSNKPHLIPFLFILEKDACSFSLFSRVSWLKYMAS